MVTLNYKTPITPGWEEMLNIDNKDTLAHALKCFGFTLPSRARKQNYIHAIYDILRDNPEKLLRPLCWDSLCIVKELVNIKSDDWVIRSVGPRFRDIQTCLLVATYTDEENLTEYYCMPDDLKKAFSPIIDGFISSEHARLHHILDQYIIGLTNLYGFCPVPLLNDYLREFGIIGNVDGLEITEKTARYLWETSAVICTSVAQGKNNLPSPYTGSKETIVYLPTAAMNLNREEITLFFRFLFDDGLIHRQYRRFSRQEVEAAGDVTPDFVFPEAEALKAYLEDEGYSPEHIKNRVMSFWVSCQFDGEVEKKPLSFRSRRLQALYDDFSANVPLWTAHGYSQHERDSGSDSAESDMDERVSARRQELAEINKGEPVKQLPVFTKNPYMKPGAGETVSRFIPGDMIETTVNIGNGLYFVCYIANMADDISGQTENNLYLISHWMQLFDFLIERYSDSYGHLDLPPYVEKKYKRICGFIYDGTDESRRKSGTYMDCIAFDNNEPFEWASVRYLKDITWGEVVILGATGHPTLPATIRSFMEDCLSIYREILRSDAKSLKASLEKLID